MRADDDGTARPEPGLRVGPPKTVAGGVPAVLSTARHALGEMGVRRSLRTLARVNQLSGFDCPGCAWPDPSERGHVEFCENGAKAVAEEATTRRVGREFFASHGVAELARMDERELGKSGRITEPMWLAPGATHYAPISWEDAFALVGERLRALPSPDAAAFYTSGRTSNEAAFCYQLFARCLGTNNLPDCSNMCHESSGAALGETIGIGKGSVSLEDVERAGLLFVVGQNPGTNHPRMLSALERAKRNGARIVAVNPLREAGLIRFKHPQRASDVLGSGTDLADLYLQIRVNGDLALFQALGRMLLEAHDSGAPVVDEQFVSGHTEGFEQYAAHVRGLDWEAVDAATGLDRSELTAAYELLAAHDRVVVCWAMGLTQHRNSVPTIREIVNVLLLRGAIGRPGAGLCPVRGHSNVQGDRTMGINESPPASFLDALGAEFAFSPPRVPGHDVVETIRAMRDGSVSVFVSLGGNFASATPDTAVTESALRSCALTVQVSTKLNRSHAVTGAEALVLPCLGRTEEDVRAGRPQSVTVEDSMSAVHMSAGTLPPASGSLRSEVAIVCGIARATLGPESPVAWEGLADDYDVIRDHVSRVVPGFESFNERVRRPGGFVLPHAPRDRREFPTATGKARFTVNVLEVVEVPDGHLLMQTVRSHDQFNTTIYGQDDRYRGVHGGRRVVFVHPDDVTRLGLVDGEVVDIVGEHRGTTRVAPGFRVVGYPTARGCCATYFPETNVLVPLDSTAEGSNTPTSKSVVVRLVRAAPAR
ncbi:MAG: FdhF/YdeP family oxidoreductase [Actinomycetota bacterium]|nr:FdhF/YdeP family oxidoreductase [Actinomycetota bacterium]